ATLRPREHGGVTRHEVMPLDERLQRLQGVPEDHVGVVRLDGDGHAEPTAVAEPTQFLPGGVVPAAGLLEREAGRLGRGHLAPPFARASSGRRVVEWTISASSMIGSGLLALVDVTSAPLGTRAS